MEKNEKKNAPKTVEATVTTEAPATPALTAGERKEKKDIEESLKSIFSKFSGVVSGIHRIFLTVTGKLEDREFLPVYEQSIHFVHFGIILERSSGTVLSRSTSTIDGIPIDFRTDLTIVKSRKIGEKDAIKRLRQTGMNIPDDFRAGKQARMYQTMIDAMLVSIRAERKESKENDEFKDIVLSPSFIFSMNFDVVYRDFSEQEAFILHAPALISERNFFIEAENKKETPNFQKLNAWKSEIEELNKGMLLSESLIEIQKVESQTK